MDKQWIVYYLDASGRAQSVQTWHDEAQAHTSATDRAERTDRQYFIAELVGVTNKLTKPTYEIKRV